MNILDLASTNLSKILHLPLVVFCFFGVIFSLLVLRQSLQMTHVLPTALSPVVRIAVISYTVFTFIVLALVTIPLFL
jgi:hypothetical protein